MAQLLQSLSPGQRVLPSNRPLSPPLTRPRLSVVIVNYRQWENTWSLIEQVLASSSAQRGEVEVMVVDNHSPPHRLVPRLRRTEGVSVRRWRRNHGFARAVNEGCRLSEGEWLLLLNPDMSVSPEFIQGVVELADRLAASEPRTGVVGFQVRHSDGSLQPSAGRFPTLARTLLGLIRPRARRKCRLLRGRRRRNVDWVTGCCLLVRRACLDDLGGFDRRYFLYYEDVDLCRRGRHRGWTVCYEPSLRAVHQHPLHGRKMPAALRLVIRHSLLAYAAQHWPRWHFHALAAIVRVEGWLRRLASWCCRNRHEANLARELSALAADMGRGELRTARRRLLHVAHGEEKSGGLAS